MSLIAETVKRLAADTNLTAVVPADRIYRVAVPQETERLFPRIVVRTVADEENNHLGGDANLRARSLEVEAWALADGQAEQAGALAAAALRDFRGVLGPEDIRQMHRSDGDSAREWIGKGTELAAFVYRERFEVWTKRAAGGA